MAVRVDEGGEQRAPAWCHFSRVGAGEGANLGCTVGGKGAPATDSNGFDDVVPGIDGVDSAAGEVSSAVVLLCLLPAICIS
jgi:hypothetical protein